MRTFIIRDMQTGQLVGEPFSDGGRFRWHGIDAWCEMPPAHGAELKGLHSGDGVMQRVYRIVDLEQGGGPVKTYGTSVYNAANDRVTRVVTLSEPAPTPDQLQRTASP